MIDVPPDTSMIKLQTIVRVGASIAILLMAMAVAFMPNLFYAPVPKIVLFFLVSMLPAILLGAEASDRFQLNLGWMVAVIGGGAAVSFVAFYLLVTFAKPEQQIAVFEIVDENNQEVSLEWDGAYKVSLAGSALSVTHLAKGNQLVVIFPEQVASVTLSVRKSSQGEWYSGSLSYTGTRSLSKALGKDLKVGS